MATNEENFKSEYKTFIIDYLLGLLGIDKNSIKNKIKENSLPFRNEMQYFYKKDKYIYFNSSLRNFKKSFAGISDSLCSSFESKTSP